LHTHFSPLHFCSRWSKKSLQVFFSTTVTFFFQSKNFSSEWNWQGGGLSKLKLSHTQCRCCQIVSADSADFYEASPPARNCLHSRVTYIFYMWIRRWVVSKLMQRCHISHRLRFLRKNSFLAKFYILEHAMMSTIF
jgi:hypothetical protein